MQLMISRRAAQLWRKQLFWPLFLLAISLGSSDAQTRRNSDLGKPLVITPPHIQGRLTSHVRNDAKPKQPCLSRRKVRGQHINYRIIDGRKCWYEARPAGRDAPSLRKNDTTRVDANECQEQAMKLDGDERRAFLRECRSGKR